MERAGVDNAGDRDEWKSRTRVDDLKLSGEKARKTKKKKEENYSRSFFNRERV